ncbi:MAG: hypothetical protein Q8L98_01400 [Chlamydiales bacterium]|nr:hypothetical protein [Chlamydiales bacterium]
MSKAIFKTQSKNALLSKIKKELSERYACYVLITCTDPSGDGKMDVEMDYEGDEVLAAFLLENAGQVFDQKLSSSK